MKYLKVNNKNMGIINHRLPATYNEQEVLCLPVLPEGYTLLKSIKCPSSGTHYINTGIVPDGEMDITIEFILDKTVSSNTYFFGTNATSSSAIYNLRTNANASTITMYVNNTSGSAVTVATWNFELGEKNILNIKSKANNNIVVNFNGSSTTKTYTPNVEPSNPIHLFNYATAATHKECEFSRFIAYKNGTLVSNLVPVKNAQDEIGMYNLVDNTFISFN